MALLVSAGTACLRTKGRAEYARGTPTSSRVAGGLAAVAPRRFPAGPIDTFLSRADSGLHERANEHPGQGGGRPSYRLGRGVCCVPGRGAIRALVPRLIGSAAVPLPALSPLPEARAVARPAAPRTPLGSRGFACTCPRARRRWGHRTRSPGCP